MLFCCLPLVLYACDSVFFSWFAVLLLLLLLLLVICYVVCCCFVLFLLLPGFVIVGYGYLFVVVCYDIILYGCCSFLVMFDLSWLVIVLL